MSLLNKIKEIFAAEEVQPTEMANLFVKTMDGVILMVKAETLLVDSEIVMVDEAGVEQPLLDGEYTLEDGTEVSVLGGKVVEVSAPEAEVEAPVEEVAASTEEIKMEVPPAGDYTLDNGDVITIDENGVVVNWVKAEAMEEVVVEEAPVETPVEVEVAVEAPVVNELEERVKELEALINNKDRELKVAKEAFAKLSSAPAVKAVDTKKFEKTEKSNGNTTLLSKVSEILSKG